MNIVLQPKTYQKAFAFQVEIEGFKSKSFAKVEGLSWGRLPYDPTLKLTRGKAIGDTDLLDWFYESPLRRDRVVVKLLDRDGFVQQRIGLEVVEVETYDLSALDNDKDENVQETVAITYRDIKELPLTDEDLAAWLKRAEFSARARVESAVNDEREAQADLVALREGVEARIARVRDNIDREVQEAQGKLNKATLARINIEARAQDEIAAAREKYAPAAT